MRSPIVIIAAIFAAALLPACERGTDEAPGFTAPHIVRNPAPPAREAPVPESAPVLTTPGAEVLTDSAITARITAGMASDPALAGADVSVNTDRGVVNLAGSVQSQEQSAVASAHAQREDGVMRIDNHLAVNPH